MKDMIDTHDGNYIVAGETDAKNINYDVTTPSCGSSDFWIAKIDGEGKKIWDKTIGGNSSETLEKVLEIPDGYLIIGSSYSTTSCSKVTDNYGAWDYWIVKIDKNGNKIWDKSFGGSSSDLAKSAIEVNGEYIIGGYSRSPKSGNKNAESLGDQDVWLIAIDSNGNKVWDKTYGDSKYNNVDELKKDQNGNIWIAGDQVGNFGDKDYWVLKIDQTGKILLEEYYGGNSTEDLKSLQIDEIGNLFLSGESWSNTSRDKNEQSKGRSDYWVIKIDSNGNKIWDKTIGGVYNEYLTDAIYNEENGLTLVGTTNSIKSGDISQERVHYSDDIWLTNLSNEGDLKWDKRMLTEGYEGGGKIANGSDNILVGSYSRSPSSYDKTSNSIENSYDFWILKLNTSGKIKPDIENLSDIEEECILTQLDAPIAKYRGQTLIAATTTEFPITTQGETIVTWVYDAGEGNILEQDQKVILQDDTKPLASSKNITVQLDAQGAVSIVPADIDNGSNDACGIADLALDITNARSGSSVNIL